MTAVAAAVTVRAQLYGALQADTLLMGRLGNDINRVQPRQNAVISSIARPFVVVALLGRGSAGPWQADQATWTLALHDEPTKLTWTLDLLTSDIRRIFADRTFDRATSGPSTYASRWIGATKDFLDKDYGTRCVLCTITTALAGT